MVKLKAKNKIFYITNVITIIMAIFVMSSEAKALDTGLDVLTATGLGTLDIRVIAMSIVNVALGLLGIIAIIIILYGGFVWMTAGGNEEKVARAKKILINGVIGLLIILLSFALTTFILNKLLEATGAIEPCDPPGITEACDDDPAGCPRERQCQPDGYWGSCYITDPTDPDCPAGPTCEPLNITPSGVLTIRNVVVRAFFDNDVDPTTVNLATFQVTVAGGLPAGAACTANNDCISDYCDINDTDTCQGDVVDGTFTVSDEKVEFRPSAACPPPNNDLKCFSANTTYEVNLLSGISCANGAELTCGFCFQTFTTGDLVDTQAPEVTDIYASSPQICQDVYTLYADFTDDAGVSHVDFSDTEGFSATDSTGWTIMPNTASVTWDTTSYPVGGVVTVTAEAFDYDDNSGSRSEDFTIRAAHCCNGIQDADEDAIDCGGEDCAACDGSACDFSDTDEGCQPNDNICASGYCEPSDCTCQSPPIIDYISPARDAGTPDDFDDDEPYGPPGSLVTIFGRNFGSYVNTCSGATDCSTVEFSDGVGGWIVARLANEVNLACENVWQDDQIIVEVPAGTALGPVKVTEGDSGFGMSDTTDDDDVALGERVINDFDPTGNARPGLCQLNPDNAAYEETIDLEGVGLAAFDVDSDKVSFGEIAGNLSGITDISNTHIYTIGVPNLSPSEVKTWVEINSEPSNALNFTVNPPPNIPIIYDYNPKEGPEGTYVTITGDNFGNAKGVNGKVEFGITEADYNFPDECADEFWSNTQIIVKVPAGIGLGSYIITVTNDDNLSDDTLDLTDDPDFGVISGFPPPGICLMEPDNGPVGVDTTLFGENYDDVDDVIFYDEVSVGGISPILGASPEEADTIDTSVPVGAVSGPVVARDTDPDPDVDSNPYNFNVGDCTLGENTCDVGQECCAAGSFKGACMPAGGCAGKAKSSFYLWQFTTGSPGPKVVELCNRTQECDLGYCQEDLNTLCHDDSDCDSGNTGPCLSAFTSPTPLFSRDGESPVNAIISARFDQDMRDSTLNDTNITVQECDDSSCTSFAGSVAGTILVFPWTWQGDLADYFNFYPDTDLNPDTWYLVTLSSNIQNASGSALVGNEPTGEYRWTFKARDSSNPGDIGCVSCDPSWAKLYFRGATLDYSGNVYDQNDVCVILDGLDYGWDWSTDPPNSEDPTVYASITNRDILPTASGDGNIDPEQTATALVESMPNPIGVESAVPTAGLSDICTLYTDFLTPVVIDKWPDCASTCLNAEIGAAFSRAMDSETLNVDNIHLYTCLGDSECMSQPPDDEVPITTPVHETFVANTCGNGNLDLGEDCDDGNIISDDGCSDICLNEGSILGGSTCGDGIIGNGEDCDDGNIISDDGCSDICLNEGSILGGSTCGDGIIGNGEECDDGRQCEDGTFCDEDSDCTGIGDELCQPRMGDSCSDICLNEGGSEQDIYYGVSFYPSLSYNGGFLIPGSYYRVVFSQDITSDVGINLGGLNFDSDGDTITDSYTWIFRAQEDFNLCQLDHVDVNPSRITLPTATLQLYRAVPYSTPDICSPVHGQRLNPYNYEWGWLSTNLGAATLVSPLRDSCGNLVIDVGEDCDDGNTVSGDGCTGVGDPRGACVNEGNIYTCGSGENLADNPGFEEIIAE